MEHTNTLISQLPDTAKDVRLGIQSVLTPEGSQGLDATQIWGTALTVAITLRNPQLLKAIKADVAEHLDETAIKAAETAAAIMGMTNIYYHTTYHLMKDDTYRTMPAKIRMNASKTHGHDSTNYELFALGASVIGQCGNCINAHDKVVKDHGISREGVQSIVRIASLLNAAAIMLSMEDAA